MMEAVHLSTRMWKLTICMLRTYQACKAARVPISDGSLGTQNHHIFCPFWWYFKNLHNAPLQYTYPGQHCYRYRYLKINSLLKSVKMIQKNHFQTDMKITLLKMSRVKQLYPLSQFLCSVHSLVKLPKTLNFGYPTHQYSAIHYKSSAAEHNNLS